jgi:hypothetical protein
MSGYRKQAGIFKLDASDTHVGSRLSKADLEKLLDKSDLPKPELDLLEFDEAGFATEKEIGKWWKKNFSAKEKQRRSFEEITLNYLIRTAYPECQIEIQKPCRDKVIDFLVAVGGNSIAVEFYGPGRGRFAEQSKIEKDIRRREEVGIELKCECVLWPFWIQRCEQNVKALFDRTVKGLGALWSCSDDMLLGNFDALFVKEVTSRFQADRNGSYGYFYEKDSEGRTKPEHPVLTEIKNGKKNKRLLVPKGVEAEDEWKWLPRDLP